MVAGKDVQEVASHAASIENVSKVYTAEHEAWSESISAEDFSQAVADMTKSSSFTHILAPGSNATKNFVPRIAALCDSSPLSDVVCEY